eukprot:4604494-Prymnesium_polylepis.2
MHDAHLALELTAQVAPAEALDARTKFVARLQVSLDKYLRRALTAVRVGHDSLGEAIGVHVSVEDATDRLPPSLLRLGRRARGEGLVLCEPENELACARIRADQPVLQCMLEREHGCVRVTVATALAMVFNELQRHAHNPVKSWCGGDGSGSGRRDLSAIHVCRRGDG